MRNFHAPPTKFIVVYMLYDFLLRLYWLYIHRTQVFEKKTPLWFPTCKYFPEKTWLQNGV